MIRVILLAIVLLFIAQCTYKSTSLQSPCVANDSYKDYPINPCVKRPANSHILL